jgi:hypothetical protein
MTFEQKFVLAAIVQGLPYVIIIVCTGISAIKRKSYVTGVLALGFAAVGARDILSVFAPVLMRTLLMEEYSHIANALSILGIAGRYVVSVALAVILLTKRRKSDNNLNPIENGAPFPKG